MHHQLLHQFSVLVAGRPDVFRHIYRQEVLRIEVGCVRARSRVRGTTITTTTTTTITTTIVGLTDLMSIGQSAQDDFWRESRVLMQRQRHVHLGGEREG